MDEAEERKESSEDMEAARSAAVVVGSEDVNVVVPSVAAESAVESMEERTDAEDDSAASGCSAFARAAIAKNRYCTG